MTWFSADPDGSDAPFTGIGDPVLVVTDKRRSLVAVAGEREYDGGYFFEGELLLVHLETGTAVSLIDHHLGRQVLGLERLSHQELRVLMAPPDDWKDGKAHVEGHPAVVHRSDWTAVEAKSLTGRDLAGPRSRRLASTTVRMPSARSPGWTRPRLGDTASVEQTQSRKYRICVEDASSDFSPACLVPSPLRRSSRRFRHSVFAILARAETSATSPGGASSARRTCSTSTSMHGRDSCTLLHDLGERGARRGAE